MSKPWCKYYDDGVAHEVDVEQFDNVVEMLLEAGQRFADKPAFSSFGASLSYTDVLRLSCDFAAYLQSELGIRKGDRVAIMVPNTLVFPVATLGILRAGGVQVNVNPLYTVRELEHQLNDAGTDTLIVYSGSTGTVADVLDRTSIKNLIVSSLGDLGNSDAESPPVDPRIPKPTRFVDALIAGASLGFEPVELHRDDLMFLQYTGGTTGLSKGAMLTHGSIGACMLQFREVSRGFINPCMEVIVTAIPMYHIFALLVNTLSFFANGATNVLITNPQDMAGFVEEWSKWKVTVFTGVNTLFNALLHTPGFADIDHSRMSFSIGGGSAIQESVSTQWKEVTGRHIKEGYGLSESSGIVTVNPFGIPDFTSSIGVPLPSTDVSLRDDQGKQVPIGEAGELCVKGPQIMSGYWRNAEATAEAMTEDGYFRTGDIATMDEKGFLRIVDRKKDMILVSGFNVFPNEIEAEVAKLDGVMECACVGIPDEKTGEAVKLFVVRSDNGLTIQDIKAFCRDRLTGYKVPRHIAFLDALPKSSVGKILRRKLREI